MGRTDEDFKKNLLREHPEFESWLNGMSNDFINKFYKSTKTFLIATFKDMKKDYGGYLAAFLLLKHFF